MTIPEVDALRPLERITYTQASAYPYKTLAYKVAKAALWALGIALVVPALLWTVARIACLPSSSVFLKAQDAEACKRYYENEELDGQSLFDRQPLTMQSSDMTLDGQILKNTIYPESKKYILVLNPNAGFYQDMTPRMMQFATLTGAHIVGYNYPGCDLSRGYTDPATLKASVHLALDAIKDRLKADEIVVYGLSIGGALLANAMEDYVCDETINYSFICDRTFSKISKVAIDKVSFIASFLLRFVNWEIDATRGFNNPEFKPLVIQRCHAEELSFDDDLEDEDDILIDEVPQNALAEELTFNPQIIQHDGIISKEASLGKEAIANGIPVFKTELSHMDCFDAYTLCRIRALI